MTAIEPDPVHLPLLDLTPFYTRSPDDLAVLIRQVDECLVTDGFLLIVGHQVPDSTRHRAREAAKRFFHQPDRAKDRFRVVDRRGWVPS
ncbi:MAG: 2-oxoglutarate and iron-dependent oxygenase domain-containing protein, partial [Ilumatobacteraceae bacterium]